MPNNIADSKYFLLSIFVVIFDVYDLFLNMRPHISIEIPCKLACRFSYLVPAFQLAKCKKRDPSSVLLLFCIF